MELPMDRMFNSRLIRIAMISLLCLAATALATPPEEGSAVVITDTSVDAGPPPAATLTGEFKSAYVVDADAGWPLVAYHERDRRQPASMLKMMTELLVLERIAEGDLRFEDPVTVSAKASKMGGSQVYVKQGETFTVRELLMALAIHSANDAAVALAEHLAGSVEAFIDLMNSRAERMGMADSEFHSVHGLPPGWRQEPDLTTARDLALLARELIKHPEALEWASMAHAPFRDGKFILTNPNKLVGHYRGLDGLKTGYTGPAGFCVTATAVQKGKRLISVVMGCPTDKARATESTRLLSYGFNAYVQVILVEEGGTALPALKPVKGGKRTEVPLAYASSLKVSVLRDLKDQVTLRYALPEKIEAPQPAGAVVGRAEAVLDGRVLGSVPVVTGEEIVKGSWLDRLFHR